MKQQQSKKQTQFSNLNHKITFLLSIFCVLVIWLVHSEFHSAEQSYDISKLKLYDHQNSSIENSQKSTNKSKKIIFLLIDSAKYSYWSQIPIIKELIQTHPQNSKILKTTVTQPTMTTQKIQTLMTGSQIFSSTSIIDAFFSSSVNVDNIITQINSKNGKTVSLGDQTWGKLFKFSTQYPCVTTFDIWDWQTCDKIIYTHFIDEVQNRNQITVGHFLALDHIGHASSSVTHPQFKNKKQQISQFIKQIISKMNDDQIVLITGDHGMRDDGNHGGGSLQESQSFLFVYSKSDELVLFNKQDGSAIVRQPDITATLALLADVAVPTNCIGIPILIPSSFVAQGNNIWMSIYQNLLVHFRNLLQLNSITCPQLLQVSQQQSQPSQISQQHQQHQQRSSSEYNPSSLYTTLLQIQSKCLVHLSHSQLHLSQIILILILLTITCLTLSVYVKSSIPEYVLVLLLALPHTFSWLIIRNSSTYYLLCLIIVVCISQHGRYRNIFSKIVSIGLIAILSQFQPMKQGQYLPNCLRIHYISAIINTPQLCTAICIIWACYSLYTNIHIKHKYRYSTTIITKIKQQAQLIIIVLVAISYVLKQAQMIQYLCMVNIVLSVVVVLAIGVCVAGGIVMRGRYSSSNDDGSINLYTNTYKYILHILRLYLIIFLGNASIPIYTLTTSILYTYISSLSTYSSATFSHHTRYYPYFCYVLSHYVWWVLGNRYEYSSIDIRQSYIFSSMYYVYVNTVCLSVHMMVPYGLVVISVFVYGYEINTRRMLMERQVIDVGEEASQNTFVRIAQDSQAQLKQQKQCKEQTAQKQQTTQNKQQQTQSYRQKSLPISSQQHNHSNNNKNAHKYPEMYTLLCKYLLFPMAWLICCFINLTYNHQKILYTVVYVPMTVIEVAKVIIITCAVIVYGLCTCL